MEIPSKWIILSGNNGGRWHAIGLRFEKIPFKNAIFDTFLLIHGISHRVLSEVREIPFNWII
jgi:hypothetical protein